MIQQIFCIYQTDETFESRVRRYERCVCVGGLDVNARYNSNPLNRDYLLDGNGARGGTGT